LPRVVIVGSGFGGLQCARRLAGKPVDVLLLDRHNYHLFTPLLYQVASSLLNPSEIAYPVRTVFRGARNVTIRLAEVTGADLRAGVVRTASGPDEPFDYLVVATGARVNFFGQDAIAARAFSLGSLPDAFDLRNHVLARFEAATTADLPTRQRLLTFVIVGAGPTGVEYAGALSELVRLMAGRDYPGIGRADVRILLLEGGNRVLPAFPPALGEDARRRLQRLGVTIRTGVMMQSADDASVTLSTGETVPCGTLVWAAGVRPNGLDEGLEVPRAKAGRIAVDDCLRVPGHERVFAIGDVAAFVQDGQPLPMLAQPAIQQGRAVAGMILRDLAGKPPIPFRYRDPGIMATVGRNAGVARIRGISLKGWLGWVSWLAVHLFFIIGFRNRVAVMLRWAWNYFFYDRPIRFIAAAQRQKTEGDGRGR
jgi:NADH:quinone reductase (non-electrogenic)